VTIHPQRAKTTIILDKNKHKFTGGGVRKFCHNVKQEGKPPASHNDNIFPYPEAKGIFKGQIYDIKYTKANNSLLSTKRVRFLVPDLMLICQHK
jgi:hypothetical protein